MFCVNSSNSFCGDQDRIAHGWTELGGNDDLLDTMSEGSSMIETTGDGSGWVFHTEKSGSVGGLFYDGGPPGRYQATFPDNSHSD
jgi:hypothetical protein